MKKFILLITVLAFLPAFPQVEAQSEPQLLFTIGMHIEPFGAQVSSIVGQTEPQATPSPDYNQNRFFRRHVSDIELVADIVEAHGGRMTVQAQTPFTTVALKRNETILAELQERGHELALHFHEDAHLGRNADNLPVSTWTAVMKEEIGFLERNGARRVRYWSGGNLYRGVLEAAANAGLEIMSDYKNPKTQQSDARLLTVNPWRPAGGPEEGDLEAFTRHDPQGRIVYLPDGYFTRIDPASGRREMTDEEYFQFLADSIRASLEVSRADRVNVFHFTIHPGEFRGDPTRPFELIDRLLTNVIDPLVKAGRIRWATFSEMADAYTEWERQHPGVDPRN